MKTFALNAEVREASKIANKALRNQGKVPCVLYGGDKQVCFSATENDLNKLVNTPDVFLVNFELEGKSYQAIVHEMIWYNSFFSFWISRAVISMSDACPCAPPNGW